MVRSERNSENWAREGRSGQGRLPGGGEAWVWSSTMARKTLIWTIGKRLEPWKEKLRDTRLGPGQNGWKNSPLFFSLWSCPEGMVGNGRQQEEHHPQTGRKEVEGCPHSLPNGLPLNIAEIASRSPHTVSPANRSCCPGVSRCGLGAVGYYSVTTPFPPGTRPLFWAPRRPVGSSSWCRINNWGSLLSPLSIRD